MTSSSFSSDELDIEIVNGKPNIEEVDLISSNCKYIVQFSGFFEKLEKVSYIKSDDTVLGIIGFAKFSDISQHICTKKAIRIPELDGREIMHHDSLWLLFSERICNLPLQYVVQLYNEADLTFQRYAIISKMQQLSGSQLKEIGHTFPEIDKKELKSIPVKQEEIFLLKHKRSVFSVCGEPFSLFIMSNGELKEYLEKIKFEVSPEN